MNVVIEKKHKYHANKHFSILSKEIEVDSNTNEDANREKLLDESLEMFLDYKNEKETHIGLEGNQ